MTASEQFKLLALGDSSLQGEALEQHLSQAQVDDLVDQGLTQVLGDLAAASMWPLATFHADTGSGLEIASLNKDYVIPIAAFQGNFRATKTDFFRGPRFVDPRCPVWYMDPVNRTLRVVPGGGTLVLCAYSADDLSATPPAFRRAVGTYAAYLFANRRIAQITALSDFTLGEAPALPTLPVAPDFPDVDITPVGADKETVEAFDAAIEKFATIGETPAFAFTDTLKDFAIDEDAAIPGYEFTAAIPGKFATTKSLPTDVNETISETETLAAKAGTVIPPVNEATVLPATFDADIQTDSSAGATSIADREQADDAEMLVAMLRRAATVINAAQIKLNSAGTLPQKLQMELEKIAIKLRETGTDPERFGLHTARLQLALQAAQLANSSGQTAYSAEVQKEVSRVGADIRLFDADMNKTVQKTQNEMAIWQAELNKSKEVFSAALAKYNALLQASQVKHGSELETWKAKLQAAQVKFTSGVAVYQARVNGIGIAFNAYQAALNQAQARKQDAEVVSKQGALQSAIQEYQSSLSRYAHGLQEYQAEIDTREREQALQVRSREWRIRSDYASSKRLLGLYEQALGAYRRLAVRARPTMRTKLSLVG